MARKQRAATPPVFHEYEVVDPKAKHDITNTLAGLRIYERDGKRFVRATELQAQWFVDHGTFKKVQAAKAEAPRAIQRTSA